MNMVLNEQEQAKQELMHFGMRGMRWGIRKADTRLALALKDGGKGSMVPGAKTVRSATKALDKKEWARFDKMVKDVRNVEKSNNAALKMTIKEINAGPGSRFQKFANRLAARDANTRKNQSALEKAEGDYVKAGKDRNSRVKAKQDALSNQLKAKMDSEISAARKSGGIVERILNPMTIEMKYTQQLTEGLARIDRDED